MSAFDKWYAEYPDQNGYMQGMRDAFEAGEQAARKKRDRLWCEVLELHGITVRLVPEGAPIQIVQTKAVEAAREARKEYPHLPWCNGDRRVPAGIPGHSCCCLNVQPHIEKEVQAARELIVEWRDRYEKWRYNHTYPTHFRDTVASAYDKCANELERALAAKTEEKWPTIR